MLNAFDSENGILWENWNNTRGADDQLILAFYPYLWTKWRLTSMFDHISYTEVNVYVADYCLSAYQWRHYHRDRGQKRALQYLVRYAFDGSLVKRSWYLDWINILLSAAETALKFFCSIGCIGAWIPQPRNRDTLINLKQPIKRSARSPQHHGH